MMVPKVLERHFPRLTETRGGIQKLRELILTLAVTGKLVPQDPNDEPAEMLLEKIKKEKERLIKEGKILKTKPLPPIKDEEIPYQLPKGWCWHPFEALVLKMGAGSTPKGGRSVYVNSGIKFIRSQNVWNDGLRLKDAAFIPIAVHNKMSGTHVKPLDLLLNITGASIGRCAEVPIDFDSGNVSQHVAILRLINKAMSPYIRICLISPYIQNLIMSQQVGISREGLSMSKLKSFPTPLPPLAEQKRIVATVDRLLSLCDQLEALRDKCEAVRGQLNEAGLQGLTANAAPAAFQQQTKGIRQRFHTLYNRPQNVAQLKQTILQLAVMGKLTQQDPTDEPADILLEKIKAEKERLIKEGKIKETKPLPPISKEEMQHPLPAGWEFARLGAISKLITDGTHQTPKYTKEGRIFLSAKNIKPFKFMPETHRYVSEEDYIKYINNKKAERNDVLLTRVGSNIGEAAVIDIDLDFAIYVSLALIKLFDESIFPPFIALWLNSPEGTRRAIENTYGYGVSQGNLNLGLINKFVLALPPLAEQERIVAEVERLFALCDQLTDKLTAENDTAEKLLETLVR